MTGVRVRSLISNRRYWIYDGRIGPTYSDLRLACTPAGRLLVAQHFSGAHVSEGRRLLDAASEMNPSPVLMKVLDVVSQGHNLWVIMEYLPGGSVRAQMDIGNRGLPESRIATYVFAVLRALKSLHSRGIIHGDVKPEKMLLTGFGRLKLGGFGCCRVLWCWWREGRPNERLGTPAYMPPGALETGEISQWSDMWALACSIFGMCGVRLPTAGLSLAAAERVITEQLSPRYSCLMCEFCRLCLCPNVSAPCLLSHPFVARFFGRAPWRHGAVCV